MARMTRTRKQRPPRDNEARAKYVYILALGDRVCKIGVSNKPNKRLSVIQMAHPEKVELFHFEKPADVPAHYVEQGALRLMKRWRKSGEWVSARPGIALLAVEAARTGNLQIARYVEIWQQWEEAEDKWTAACDRYQFNKYSPKDDPFRMKATKERDDAWEVVSSIKEKMTLEFRGVNIPLHESLIWL